MGRETIYTDGAYLEANPTWHEEDSSWKAQQIISMLSAHGIVPSSVGEVGCGAGEILNCLAAHYGDAVTFSGFEVSPQAFDICRNKQRQNLQFFLGNFFDTTGLPFGLVLAIDVIEHIEDYFTFLRNLKSKGAYKIFHIPLDLSVQTVLRSSPILRGRASAGHIHYFTKETALATLKDTGYDVVDCFYTRASLELPTRDWKTKLASLPRRLFFALHQDLAVRILGGCSLLVLAK